MDTTTRRIGLSLGADLCWPICYEAIVRQLDLKLPIGREQVSFEVERVTIEPYDLRQPCRYDVVLDRLTHWYGMSREWIKKAVIMDGLYVFNNPWAIQSMEKHTSYCAMMRLGMPVPDTWMVPAKAYDWKPDLEVTLQRYARLFDLGEVGEKVGYPMYMKPYDGGGWQGVSRLDDETRLRESYEASGTHLMHLQRAVDPWDRFVRCIALGPQTRVVRYDPAQPLHDRYTMDRGFVSDDERSLLEDMTLTINAFFNWDFNSCEAMHRDGVWHPIDFANACPDSQVTSLHFHFPWMVMANLRWSLFCAATKRPMKLNQDWAPFYAVADSDLPYREKLRQWAAIAHQRFDTANFTAFCATYLPHLEQVTRDFFATEVARDAVRQKVAALYPEHEVEAFTQLFWDRIQQWRESPIEAPVSVTVPAAAKPMTLSETPPPAPAQPTPAPSEIPPAPSEVPPPVPVEVPPAAPRATLHTKPAAVRAAAPRKPARPTATTSEADAAVAASVSKAAARAAKTLARAAEPRSARGGKLV
ncbi:MAG: hypothetical protein ABIS67_09490 [Candidatus Eisenbacteria bacterium]